MMSEILVAQETHQLRSKAVPFSVAAHPCYRAKKGPDLHAMVAEVECYFDDSSDEQRAKYCAYGFLIGSIEQWNYFDTLWGMQTKELQEPFRSTECECGHGQFKDWSKKKRDELMKSLVDLIDRLKLYGFASVVPVKEFREIFPKVSTEEAFTLAAAHCIWNIVHIVNKANWNVALWFEHGPHNGMVLDAYNSFKEENWKPGEKLTGIYFESKRLLPLQSADLVAREAFKHIDNLGTRKIRKPVQRMSDTLFFMLWDQSALKYFSDSGWPQDSQINRIFENEPGNLRLKYFWKTSWKFYEQKNE